MGSGGQLRFSILGILTAEHEAVQALIRRAQRRGLLAYLLMNGNHFVSVSSLIEAMWGGA